MTSTQSSRAVWKFPLPQGAAPAPVDVEMPARSEIVHFDQQDDTPTIWALVNPDETERETRRILVLPTGYSTAHGPLLYLGMAKLHDGLLIAHGFEVMASA